jgi:hypothetical protein
VYSKGVSFLLALQLAINEPDIVGVAIALLLNTGAKPG